MGGMDGNLKSLPPIYTSHLFPQLEAKLIALLRGLAPEDWEKQTLAPKWKVKDVAAHLLDTELRRLAIARRGHETADSRTLSYAEIVEFVNRLNEAGVQQYRQLSKTDLISRIEKTSTELTQHLQSLDPFARAVIPVSWAGEDESANWFDTAREFTERWHHQQQIRAAVDKLDKPNTLDDPGIMTREFYFPVLDCFMRGLPHTYRNVEATHGSLAQFTVSGDCGGSWYLLGENDAWRLIASPAGEKISETVIPQQIAWRIFTKGIAAAEARSQVRLLGDEIIGLHILKMISIAG
ncbi:MAG TPA: maleylpyruvate isomerase N-terminal domain-containing protein [Candidatus Acidoferrales bacterium]|jgi:uncharacterized protein (TIGR03083 family)|nr:maleylpyruvate isomerase N-terminal domain-containing protein [Candidatus Acidoferrales bacterium]